MSEEDKVRKKQEKVLQGQRLKAIAERRRQEKVLTLQVEERVR